MAKNKMIKTVFAT